MRSASVDNRSRAIWLLAGLGVLIWAVLSVFLGGSPAHADEPVVQPPKQMQQARAAHHAQPPAPPAPRAEAQQKRAQRQSAAPQKPAPRPAQQKPTAQRPLAGHTIVPPPTKPAAPRPTAALSQAASARMDAATQRRAAAMQAREEARSLPQRTAHIAARANLQDRDEHRADRDHVGDPHQRSPQADAATRHDAREAARHQTAQATKRASDSTRGAHTQHSPRTSAATSVRTAPAPAAVTPAATSGAASEKEPAPSPFDTRGASSQHQPAAPPTASSAGVGPSASAGVLPGALQASDVLGPLLAAVHAGDPVLPTGPAGSTDHSPD